MGESIKNVKWAAASLYAKGCDIAWLSRKLGVTQFKIETWFSKYRNEEDMQLVKVADVEAFRKLVRPYDSFSGKFPEIEDEAPGARKKTKLARKHVTVEECYPFIVKTNIGTLQWSELLMAIRRNSGFGFESGRIV